VLVQVPLDHARVRGGDPGLDQVARQYVMLAYDVQADRLDSAVRLTPGIESPTISPLHREGWVAVQAMVQRTDVHKIMDELYDVGARAILVTDIHACRL
jgi:ATP phosphoribosyltransferase